MDSDTRDLLYDARYQVKQAEKFTHVLGHREREGQIELLEKAVVLIRQAQAEIRASKPTAAQFAGIADTVGDL